MDDLLFPAVLAGAVLLALIGLGCLLFCRGKSRRYLARTAYVFVPTFALFIGGELLLGMFDLTWRSLPAGIFCGVLLLSGIIGILLILCCLLPLEMSELAPCLRWTVKGAALASAGLVLYCALVYGGLLALFGFGGGERVLEYQGQTLLEVDRSFLDPLYDYYQYHGPLVRGNEALYEGLPTHIDGDCT